jgi:hypothetical protein
MSERNTWVTCPDCCGRGAVGWQRRGGEVDEPVGHPEASQPLRSTRATSIRRAQSSPAAASVKVRLRGLAKPVTRERTTNFTAFRGGRRSVSGSQSSLPPAAVCAEQYGPDQWTALTRHRPR